MIPSGSCKSSGTASGSTGSSDGKNRLEKQVEDGFAVRDEARSDFRTLVGIQLTMFLAMVLGFAGIAVQHYL